MYPGFYFDSAFNDASDVPDYGRFRLLVWFGLVMIIAIETGMITPPFGMNVFTVKSSLYGMDGMEGITVNEIFAGSMWFLAAIIIVDLICIFIPQIVLFLPNAM